MWKAHLIYHVSKFYKWFSHIKTLRKSIHCATLTQIMYIVGERWFHLASTQQDHVCELFYWFLIKKRHCYKGSFLHIRVNAPSWHNSLFHNQRQNVSPFSECKRLSCKFIKQRHFLFVKLGHVIPVLKLNICAMPNVTIK